MKPNDNSKSANGNTENNKQKELNFLQVFGSVIAAAFGVQSSKNRDRDFKSGNFSHFALAGVIFVTIFVLILTFTVNMVLHSST